LLLAAVADPVALWWLTADGSADRMQDLSNLLLQLSECNHDDRLPKPCCKCCAAVALLAATVCGDNPDCGNYVLHVIREVEALIDAGPREGFTLCTALVRNLAAAGASVLSVAARASENCADAYDKYRTAASRKYEMEHSFGRISRKAEYSPPHH
jgi:hypothetical protein